ncbi:MAG: hypothetical protein OXH76_20770 [Boseongicola sp.]|nr:hypothetical protein [Boseongicola sp.]
MTLETIEVPDNVQAAADALVTLIQRSSDDAATRIALAEEMGVIVGSETHQTDEALEEDGEAADKAEPPVKRWNVPVFIRSEEIWSGEAVVEAATEDEAKEKALAGDMEELEWIKSVETVGSNVSEIDDTTAVRKLEGLQPG